MLVYHGNLPIKSAINLGFPRWTQGVAGDHLPLGWQLVGEIDLPISAAGAVLLGRAGPHR